MTTGMSVHVDRFKNWCCLLVPHADTNQFKKSGPEKIFTEKF